MGWLIDDGRKSGKDERKGNYMYMYVCMYVWRTISTYQEINKPVSAKMNWRVHLYYIIRYFIG